MAEVRPLPPKLDAAAADVYKKYVNFKNHKVKFRFVLL